MKIKTCTSWQAKDGRPESGLIQQQAQMLGSKIRDTAKITKLNIYHISSINCSDIPASDHDAPVRFYLRKTTFNWQNHKLYPNQATRPEWAHRLNCWSCETFLGLYNIETLVHAVISCPNLLNIRKQTLGIFGLLKNAPQQTTPAHSILWGNCYRSSTCESQCNFWVICLTIILRLKSSKFATKNRLTTLILAKIFLKLIELFYELNPGV